MREIKFRAWDNVCSCYVEDNWKFYLNGGVSIESTWATKDIVIEQYIGQNDKNGKEIYENDIINHPTRGDYEVGYNPKRLQFGAYSRSFEAWITNICIDSDCEIIGNIHEGAKNE